jgi:phosphotriesterase-related protein
LREDAIATIHTVLGEIDPAGAGITLTHEHIVCANPGCEYDHQTIYDVEEVAADVAAQLDRACARNGISSMVDLTPVEVGRNPLLLTAVAEKTKVNIIGATGFFPERIGIPYHFRKQDVGYRQPAHRRQGRHHQGCDRLRRRP